MSVVGTDHCVRDQHTLAEEPFSLRQPKDIRAGLSSGLQSVSKGVLGGAVTLLAAPLVGASQDGLSGFAKGVVAGVAGAVVLPVTGVSLGVVQVVRGVLAQPAAISGYLRGQVWDEVGRCWVPAPVGQLARYDPTPLLAASGLRLGTLGTDYYALLQLPRDAPPEAVRRAYYLLARVWHPDKNPGDAGAKARFQALGEAYQVLSNPVLRARYDAHGAAGLGAAWVDPALFFGCLFGSEAFTHLVGELLLATLAGAPGEVPPAELRSRQAARVAQLTAALASILRRYVEEDVEGFTLAQREEAQRLAQASFGVPLLTTIARCYRSAADAYLGGLVGGTWARVKAGTDLVRSHLDFAGAAFRAVTAEEALEAAEEQEAAAAAAAAAQQPAPAAVGTVPAVEVGAATTTAAAAQQSAPSVEVAAATTAAAAAAGTSSLDALAGVDAEVAAAVDGQEQAQDNNCSSSLQQPQQQQGQQPVCSTPPEQQAGSSTACPTTGSSSSLGSWCDVTPPTAAAGSTTTSTSPAAHTSSSSSISEVPTGSAVSSGRDGWEGAGSCSQNPPQQQQDQSLQEDRGEEAEDWLEGAALGASCSSASQQPQESKPQQQQDSVPSRAALEDATAESALAAMWAANALDIQRTLGAVTRALLYDRQMGRRVCRRRAMALRLLADIYSSARAMDGASLTRPARHHLEAAFAAMVEKQVQRDEEAAAAAAAMGQGQDA